MYGEKGHLQCFGMSSSSPTVNLRRKVSHEDECCGRESRVAGKQFGQLGHDDWLVQPDVRQDDQHSLVVVHRLFYPEQIRIRLGSLLQRAAEKIDRPCVGPEIRMLGQKLKPLTSLILYTWRSVLIPLAGVPWR